MVGTATDYLPLFILAMFTAVVAPLFMLYVTGRQRRQDTRDLAAAGIAAAVAATKERKAEKQADWDRQDAVAQKLLDAQAASARKAEEVSDAAQAAAKALMLSQQKTAEAVATKAAEAADLLVASNAQVADLAEKNNATQVGKLDVIHTLVNSSLTAALQSELDAKTESLVFFKELLATKNGPPAADVLQKMETKIHELQAVLNDRAAAQAVVNNELGAQQDDAAEAETAAKTEDAR
jgi:hypothetical protein